MRTINQRIERLLTRTDYESFVLYMDLNDEFHSKLLQLARSPMLERALEGILSLPFAGPSAFVLTEALLPESRTILVLGHSHHAALIEAIERRQSARAESIAREHARIAVRNLEIVTRHREMLAAFPGSSLIALPTPAEREPA